MPWKSRLINLVRNVDAHTDELRHLLRQHLGAARPVHIVPFRSYGTPTSFSVRGRVLRGRPVGESTAEDSGWQNLLNMYRRFESDEVRGATVEVSVPGGSRRITTDAEGYFHLHLELSEALPSADDGDLYHEVPLTLVDAPYHFEPFSTEAEVMIPPSNADVGVISDIDDTIIRTDVHNLLAMGRTVLFSNARTRLPFPGVAEFYQALLRGRNGAVSNPFFYVSSSPWNLYDLIVDFLDHNRIPAGPLLLRDFGIGSESFTSGNYLGHKFTEISNILARYPQISFILIGDSSEQDPGIYLEVVRRHPGRIAAVYIRDVAPGEKHRAAKEAREQMRGLGVEMLLTADSVEAAEHAAGRGFIYRAALPAVEVEKEKDTGDAPGKVEAGETTEGRKS